MCNSQCFLSVYDHDDDNYFGCCFALFFSCSLSKCYFFVVVVVVVVAFVWLCFSFRSFVHSKWIEKKMYVKRNDVRKQCLHAHNVFEIYNRALVSHHVNRETSSTFTKTIKNIVMFWTTTTTNYIISSDYFEHLSGVSAYMTVAEMGCTANRVRANTHHCHSVVLFIR